MKVVKVVVNYLISLEIQTQQLSSLKYGDNHEKENF